MIELILSALALLAYIAVIVLVEITFEKVIEWFEDFFRLRTSEAANKAIAFTIQEAINKGEVKYIQGVFNKSTNTVESARRLESKQVDKQLESYHSDKKLVIYS